MSLYIGNVLTVLSKALPQWLQLGGANDLQSNRSSVGTQMADSRSRIYGHPVWHERLRVSYDTSEACSTGCHAVASLDFKVSARAMFE